MCLRMVLFEHRRVCSLKGITGDRGVTRRHLSAGRELTHPMEEHPFHLPHPILTTSSINARRTGWAGRGAGPAVAMVAEPWKNERPGGS